jgi:hypothetical protein
MGLVPLDEIGRQQTDDRQSAAIEHVLKAPPHKAKETPGADSRIPRELPVSLPISAPIGPPVRAVAA